MKPIVLIVWLTTGETIQTPYATEWPCITEAAKANQAGQQAFCLIQTPSKTGPSEKYPK